LVSGTVVPHSTPAVVRASRAKIRVLRIPSSSTRPGRNLTA
jgi:hypothetical protein